MKKWSSLVVAMVPLLLIAPQAFAQDVSNPNDYKGLVAVGAGIAMGFAVLGAGLGQGVGIAAALLGISRNPQASGKITIPMFAGLAFVESLVIFTFLVAYGLAGKV